MNHYCGRGGSLYNQNCTNAVTNNDNQCSNKTNISTTTTTSSSVKKKSKHTWLDFETNELISYHDTYLKNKILKINSKGKVTISSDDWFPITEYMNAFCFEQHANKLGNDNTIPPYIPLTNESCRKHLSNYNVKKTRNSTKNVSSFPSTY